MKKRSIFILIIIVALVLVPLSSCSDRSNKTTKEWLKQRDCAYFETKPLEIPSSMGEAAVFTLSDASAGDDAIALLLTYSDRDSYETLGNEVVFMDPEGVLTGRFSPEDSAPGISVIAASYDSSDRLVVLGKSMESGYRLLTISSANDRIEADISVSAIPAYLTDMIPTENGWALLGYNSIYIIDEQGQLIHEEPLVGESMGGGLFLENGCVQSVVYNNDGASIFSLDLKSMTSKVISPSDMKWGKEVNLLMMHSFHGAYASDGNGVFKFNFTDGVISEIADWNRIDIPPSPSAKYLNELSILSDNIILRSAKPMTSRENDELVLLIHRDMDPNADKKVLTIGGYAPRNDLIEHAVYLYNTGDNDYRIELTDYWDLYPYVDATDISRANASIIADMSSGKSDDMFIGLEFDYDLWGDSGMVMDMSGLFGNESILDQNDFLPCVTELTKHNGKIYKIFPSFTIMGYAGYSEVIGADNRFTIDRVFDISAKIEPDQMMFPPASRTNLALGAILYQLDDFIVNGKFSISEEDLLKIAEYADAYGFADDEAPPSVDSNLYYVTGRLLFQEAYIDSPEAFRNLELSGTSSVHFYGYPSVLDSARMCSPSFVIAISSGAENPEACLDFIQILLSDEVQEYAMDSGRIPVSVNIFEKQISRAMTEKKDSSGQSGSSPMTADCADRYRECVDSINYIQYLSIDLWLILRDEFESYYSENKDISSVRDTMINRINLYLEEKKS